MKKHKFIFFCFAGILQVGFIGTTLATTPSESHFSQQQGIVQRGTVIGTDGEALIGVNVSVKGSTQGTITDFDGRFELDVKRGDLLVFSYIGYKDQEITVTGEEIKITLRENTELLDEVIVIGYGTSRKKDITGSVISVKAKELNTVSSSSVSQMLQGKVTGMNAIQNSAQPGAGISINIRGAVSPHGSNAPLYVIDGVPLQNNSTADPGIFGYDYKTGVDRDPLNSINPNDIESIEVLKDASAAAIYGASAANGVILITTKNGKSGKPKVDFRSVVTAQLQKDYPDVLNAHDFREQANFWTKEFYLYNNKMGIYGNNPINLDGYTPVFENVNGYAADTNWMDVVSRDGYIIDENLSVNGGTEKTKYFFSYNFYNNVGLLKQSDMKRHSIRMNLDQEFTSIFKGGIKMSYSNVVNNSTSVGSAGSGDNMLVNALRFAPDIPIYDELGNYSHTYNKLINNPASFSDVEDKTTTERVFIAPILELKLFDGLSLRGVGGFDSQNSVRQFYIPVKAGHMAVSDGMANIGYAKVLNLSTEGFFNYDKIFDDTHHISAVLGAGWYKTMDEGFGLAAFDFFTDAFGCDNVGIASDKEKQQMRSWRNERIKLSQFIRLNYSVLDRYILTFTARRDGSSYFSENHKWGIFPSISAAWRISEEVFMKKQNLISDLKLRIGYGTVGNENILGSNTLSLYKSGYNYLLGNTLHTGLALSQIANPDLKWETNYTLNIGIDYGFLNQRINGSIEYFHRGAKDLLDYQQLPSNNAVGRVAANIGETESKGFEFSLNSENLKSSKLKWSTQFNLSYFKANWVKRNPAVQLADYVEETGDLDAIYGWKTNGIITCKEDIPNYMPNANIGNPIYVDIDNNGVLDSKDVVKLGNSIPRWLAGLGNTFSYKGFDLNFYFYGAFGHKRSQGQLPDVNVIGNNGNAPGNTYVSIREVWNSQTEKGWMPGIATDVYHNSNPSGANDFYLMKGNYVKLKNITLGYTLPQKLFNSSKFIQNARFFIDAQNVATFTKYEGFDPELSVNNPYPQALLLSFGFNLNF